MPIYEYQCQQCGHQLEALQKISDPPLSECPQCQEQALHKLVSAASFRLKGGGWYETDFKSGNKKHLADSGDGGATNGAGAGTDSGEGEKSPTKDSKDTGKSEKSASSESKGSDSEKKAKPAASGDGKKSPASSK